jgi:quinol monooxygenase YgiN
VTNVVFQQRELVSSIAAGTLVLADSACASRMGEPAMYGLIGKMKAAPGQRDALIDILLEGVSEMPGCLSYVVARDPADPEAIWVTEVWDSQNSHQASLSLPSVKAAMARGRPLIASFDQYIETAPVGGHGIGATA